MPQAAGIASAVLRRIQMVAGAVASALVPALYHGHSSLPMTGVMAGCAITALLIYLLGLRHAEQVVTGASASPAE
jgi:DHA1 family bicyclomycin/chloramphenicol resistance-like MFS transporter